MHPAAFFAGALAILRRCIGLIFWSSSVMAGKRGIPFKRGRHVCVFCGGTPISREHIWPDWLQPYIPKKTKSWAHIASHRLADTSFNDNSPSAFRVVRKSGPGDVRSQRLKVTCIPCNTGWISQIDESVKPLFLALADGRWGYFSSEHRRILGTWATRFAMVFEFRDPHTVIATQAERDYFRLTRDPPKGWYVFATAYNGIKWANTWNHRAAIQYDPSEKVAAAVADNPKMQSTVLCFGQLLLNVVSGSVPVDFIEYGRYFGLRLVWPEMLSTFAFPTSVYDDEAVSVLAWYFGGASETFR
jgi:hypothetical protein